MLNWELRNPSCLMTLCAELHAIPWHRLAQVNHLRTLCTHVYVHKKYVLYHIYCVERGRAMIQDREPTFASQPRYTYPTGGREPPQQDNTLFDNTRHGYMHTFMHVCMRQSTGYVSSPTTKFMNNVEVLTSSCITELASVGRFPTAGLIEKSTDPIKRRGWGGGEGGTVERFPKVQKVMPRNSGSHAILRCVCVYVCAVV